MGRAEGGKLHVIGYSWPLGGSQSALAFRSTDSGYSARHDAIRDEAGPVFHRRGGKYGFLADARE